MLTFDGCVWTRSVRLRNAEQSHGALGRGAFRPGATPHDLCTRCAKVIPKLERLKHLKKPRSS